MVGPRPRVLLTLPLALTGWLAPLLVFWWIGAQISAQGFIRVEDSFPAGECRDSIADPEITTDRLAVRRIDDICNRRKTPRLRPKFRVSYGTGQAEKSAKTDSLI